MVGEEEARHASIRKHADRLSGDVDHLKVQLEILKSDRARGLAALSEIEKILQEDGAVGSLIQVVARKAE